MSKPPISHLLVKYEIYNQKGSFEVGRRHDGAAKSLEQGHRGAQGPDPYTTINYNNLHNPSSQAARTQSQQRSARPRSIHNDQQQQPAQSKLASSKDSKPTEVAEMPEKLRHRAHRRHRTRHRTQH